MDDLELDEEMSLIVLTTTATAFCLVSAMTLFPPSFYCGSMLCINNHLMPPISQPVTHEFIYPDEEIIHPTGRIRYANHSLPSRPLLFQHTRIAIDHPASSSVSNSFLSDKHMYEWPQITKPPLQGSCNRIVSFVAMITMSHIHLPSPNASEISISSL